jgi:hypothetical protein
MGTLGLVALEVMVCIAVIKRVPVLQAPATAQARA